jgi:hypothetical protein
MDHLEELFERVTPPAETRELADRKRAFDRIVHGPWANLSRITQA